MKDTFKLLKQSIFKINYHLIKSDEDTATKLNYTFIVQIKRLEQHKLWVLKSFLQESLQTTSANIKNKLINGKTQGI